VFANPEVWQFPYGRAFDREETRVFLDMQMAEWGECGFGCWVAVHRAERRIIGYLGLSVPMFLPEILPAVEVGWRFDPGYWGQGLATEGARAALREGFTTLGLEEITSVPQADNPPSARVCERLAMTLDRVVSIPANDRRGELEALLSTHSRRLASQQLKQESANMGLAVRLAEGSGFADLGERFGPLLQGCVHRFEPGSGLGRSIRPHGHLRP